MPAIPFYQQQTNQGQAQFARVREQDVSSGLQDIARGLGDVGQGLQAQQIELAQKQHKADLESDRLEIAKRNSQIDLDLQNTWSDFQSKYKEGDNDAPQKLFSYLDDYTKNATEGLKTEQGQAMIQSQLADIRSQWGRQAIQWQAQENAREKIAGLDTVAENYKRATIQNPAKAQEYAAQYKASVDSLDLAPQYKREAINKTVEGIAFTAEQAIADKNPGASFKQGSRWSFDALDADKQLKLMDFARQRQKQYAAEARQAIAMQLSDVTAQLMDGQQPSSMPSAGSIRAAFGDKAEPILRQLQGAQQYGQDVKSFAMMPDSEIQQVLAQRQPTQTEGYARASQLQDSRIRAAQQVVTQRNKSPASFVLQHSPDVASAYNQMSQYLSDPSATPEQQQQAAQIYATKSLAMQNEMGVAKPQIVPKQYADDIVAGFYQQAEGGENAATLIQQQQQLWGSMFPQVIQQIGHKLPKEAQVIATGVPKDLSERLASTATLKDEQLFHPLQKGQKAEIQQSVATALEPFAQSLRGQVGGTSTYSTFYDAAVRTTASYVLGGMDPSKAARKVADGMINDKYQFADTYRIPKDLDTTSVRRGTEVFVQSLTPSDLFIEQGVVGVPKEVTEQQYLQAVKQGGQWVTNGDETGLTLTANGYRVLDKNGHPITKTWDELMNKAISTPRGPYDIIPGQMTP